VARDGRTATAERREDRSELAITSACAQRRNVPEPPRHAPRPRCAAPERSFDAPGTRHLTPMATSPDAASRLLSPPGEGDDQRLDRGGVVEAVAVQVADLVHPVANGLRVDVQRVGDLAAATEVK
jgi:hypothetical protein